MLLFLAMLFSGPCLADDQPVNVDNTTWTVTGFDGTTTPTTVNLIWTTPGQATTATVFIGLAANDLSLRSVRVANAAVVHQLTIPGLSPQTRYYFEVVATDADGVSVYSNVISKATKAASAAYAPMLFP